MIRKVCLAAGALFSLVTDAQSLKDAIRYSDNEQFEKAASLFKQLLPGDKTGDVYYYYGENYYNNDNQDTALIIYQEGLTKFPSNPILMAGLGKAMHFKGDPKGKARLFEADTYVSSGSSKLSNSQKVAAYVEIAQGYIAIESPKQAIDVLNKAMKLEAGNPAVYLAMGDALRAQDPTNGTPVIQQYKKAADLDKTSPKGFFKTGELYLAGGNPEAALEWIDNALKLDSTFAPAWRVKGEALYKKNQIENAIKAYKKYLSLNNNNLSARVRYVSFLYVAKKYADVITEAQSIQKDYPATYPNVINRLLAKAYYEKGDYATGLSTMELFLGKQPENKVLAGDYEYYGKMLTKSNKDSLALEYFNKALKKDSTRTDIYDDLGTTYTKMKKHGEAAAAYEKKLQGKKNVTVNDWYYLGKAYYSNKDYKKADSAFMEYTNIQKDIPFGYIWRARSQARLDSMNTSWAAKPYYEKVILLTKPEDVEKSKRDLDEAWYYLGLHYYKTRNYGMAKCAFQKVMELKVNADKKESNYTRAKEALDVAEIKGATAATECVKAPQ
ncbi:MAG: tetratricopeptide repeat protein [Bacteroidota bacterium]